VTKGGGMSDDKTETWADFGKTIALVIGALLITGLIVMAMAVSDNVDRIDKQDAQIFRLKHGL